MIENTSPRTVRFFIAGLGNIGRRFMSLVASQEGILAARYGLRLVPVGAADSSGAALDPAGLDASRIVAMKEARQGVAGYPSAGRPGLAVRQALAEAAPDLFVEATPTNLRDAEPGLGCIRDALGHGTPVVTASKGPLVLAYQELMGLAARSGVRLGFSATVAGGLPTVNLGRRDLAGSTVQRVEGILNGTTNYILTTMAEEGLSFDEALAEARRRGHAEADPSLDVDGWDAAAKLLIVASSVLHRPTTLADIDVEGIRGVTPRHLAQASRMGKVIKLLALAERVDDDYRLSVHPTALERVHPLARLSSWQMGVRYTTDTMGVITAVIDEPDPWPTAAAVLRDVIDVFGS
ncbi:MAG TPA: homoserine dehydrogenase [Anaerolineae bacterium]|nr:homoserine dehydrogenase [Anaerolineae bacterium]HOQ99544.1 homoserine dehydrogenase [Anaerolineae bacterium]HPL27854.1 homoserine dehydrogenase [Anaerolineae bacterium]